MSTAPEIASTLSVVATTAAETNRRSYRCYNCNHSFHISPVTDSATSSPSAFRCPRCHFRHLIPRHIISPSSPPVLPSPPPPLPPTVNSNNPPGGRVFTYYTSDDSDSDYDYDSDSSLLSFTAPNIYQSTPALRSFVNSLPIKLLPPNTMPSLQSCSICLEDFEINSKTDHLLELPCEHYFHKDCIEEWLKRSHTCPLCRFRLPVEVEQHQEEGPNEWEEEEADLLPDLTPIGMLVVRSSGEVQSLSADAETASARLFFSGNGEISNGSVVDAMHDEEGDTLMVDA